MSVVETTLTPVTTPVPLPTVTKVLLALHTPPGVGSLSVTLDPTHTTAVPLIGSGKGFTVTV